VSKTSRNEWAERRIGRILGRAEYRPRRCPICGSTVVPERLHGGRVAWRCGFCPYVSIDQGHRDSWDRWRAAGCRTGAGNSPVPRGPARKPVQGGRRP